MHRGVVLHDVKHFPDPGVEADPSLVKLRRERVCAEKLTIPPCLAIIPPKPWTERRSCVPR